MFIAIPYVQASNQLHNTQRVTYEVYGGGFHVVDATFDLTFSDTGEYNIALSANTRGFLGSLAPWEGTFSTEGWYDPQTNSVQPRLHQSSTTWDDELEVHEYNYTKDGAFVDYRVTDEHSDREKRDIAQELTKGTTDLFSAAFDIMKAVSNGKPCAGNTQEVFDGKRKFRMVFHEKEDVVLEQSRYNIFAGDTRRCGVEVEQIAGNWHKKPRGWMSIQEQSRKNGMLPTIWMAQLTPKGPAIPVKIFVKTQYGALFMHMVKYENNGAIQLAFSEDD